MPARIRACSSRLIELARKKDFTHWTYGSFNSGAQAAGTVGQLVSSAQHLPETLLRIRGTFSSYLDGLKAPGISVAVGVTDKKASTAAWEALKEILLGRYHIMCLLETAPAARG